MPETRQFSRQYHDLEQTRKYDAWINSAVLRSLGLAPIVSLNGACNSVAKNLLACMRLVYCPSNTFTKSFDFSQDWICSCSPHKWPWMFVIVINKAFYLFYEIFDTAEGSPSNSFLGDDIEPNLHLIEPWSIGRGIMDMIPWACSQPSSDLCMLVRGIVIDDEMDC